MHCNAKTSMALPPKVGVLLDTIDYKGKADSLCGIEIELHGIEGGGCANRQEQLPEHCHVAPERQTVTVYGN